MNRFLILGVPVSNRLSLLSYLRANAIVDYLRSAPTSLDYLGPVMHDYLSIR